MRPKPFLENRDYSKRTSDGALVFSREYLLSRGTCCKSKCRNCPYEHSSENLNFQWMRPIVSMVPSWTETLIHARANVVGRTRFCIHPADSVREIPSLGGTKTLASSAAETMTRIVNQAEANGVQTLVILDREENPKIFVEFFEQFNCEIVSTHVADLHSLKNDLLKLAERLKPAPNDSCAAISLEGMAGRLEALKSEIPEGVMPTIEDAVLNSSLPIPEIDRLLWLSGEPIFYFIWRNPWMIVSKGTWIAASISSLFPKAAFVNSALKYPEINEDEIPLNAILLFSSEPYPFEKHWSSILDLPFVGKAKAVLLVDGESFSWFGIRSIRFLEDCRIST